MSVDANQLVQRGMMAHQQGNLPEAERLYKQALAANPNHFEGLHFLGLAVAHQGNPEEGERLVTEKGATDATTLARYRDAWDHAADRTPHGTPIELKPEDFR